MNFKERLDAALERSAICIGLDTDVSKIPPVLRGMANPIFEFNKAIIDSTADLAGAYKPNFAFYEAHGPMGLDALYATVEYVRKFAPHAITIADAKRGDIGNTAAMYAKAAFEDMGFDSVTVNPYMGFDSVEPFIANENFGAFILCLTSNPGSKDFQYVSLGDARFYETVAKKAGEWNTRANCGLVVGATHADEMRSVRASAGSMPFLIPGVGAQGGDLESAVRINFDGRKINAFINSSRAIIYASSEKEFASAARHATIEMKNKIEKILQTAS